MSLDIQKQFFVQRTLATQQKVNTVVIVRKANSF